MITCPVCDTEHATVKAVAAHLLADHEAHPAARAVALAKTPTEVEFALAASRVLDRYNQPTAEQLAEVLRLAELAPRLAALPWPGEAEALPVTTSQSHQNLYHESHVRAAVVSNRLPPSGHVQSIRIPIW